MINQIKSLWNRKISYTSLPSLNNFDTKPNSQNIKNCHVFNNCSRTIKFILYFIIIISNIFVIIYWEAILNSLFFKNDYTLNILLNKPFINDGCEIPKLDPWDPSIKKFLKIPKPLKCSILQPEITYLDESDGNLYFNNTELNKVKFSNTNLPFCQYRCFDRKNNDYNLFYWEWTHIKNNQTSINCEFIDVRCYTSNSSMLPFYKNTHNQIIIKDLRTKKLTKNLQKKKLPSVLLFVIDSTSHSNWKRALPKTLKVLQEHYNSTVFDGFVKTGENSFPNAISFLTGKNIENNELPILKTYDNWPLIWYDYEKTGYSTYFAEDFIYFSLFTFLQKGFNQQPTNNYFLPFWRHVSQTILHKRSTPFCYGTNKRHLIQLNYLKQFLKKNNRFTHTDDSDGQHDGIDDHIVKSRFNDGKRILKGRPTFTLNWLSELSHDNVNKISQADNDFADFFTEMKTELEDHFVFVFGDHGNRMDNIRQSLIGRIEGQMPFFSMHVPNWLSDSYPQLQSIIKNNSKQLTSFWDLYITLKDILHLADNNAWNELNNTQNFIKKKNGDEKLISDQPIKRFQKFSKRGLSLLRPLPLKRTCVSADIPDQYCVCQKEAFVSVNDNLIIKAAQKIIDYINLNIQKENSSTKCAKLELKTVNSGQVFLPNVKMLNSNDHAKKFSMLNNLNLQKYRVTVTAAPSDGMFEAIVQKNMENGNLKVVGNVERINIYGNQSSCLDNSNLKKYCYCT